MSNLSSQLIIRSSNYSSNKTYWHGICINKLELNRNKILKTTQPCVQSIQNGHVQRISKKETFKSQYKMIIDMINLVKRQNYSKHIPSEQTTQKTFKRFNKTMVVSKITKFNKQCPILILLSKSTNRVLGKRSERFYFLCSVKLCFSIENRTYCTVYEVLRIRK